MHISLLLQGELCVERSGGVAIFVAYKQGKTNRAGPFSNLYIGQSNCDMIMILTKLYL